MATQETPFGLLTVAEGVDSGTVPTAAVVGTPNGNLSLAPMGLVRITGSAPNWNPTSVPGRPSIVYNATDHKIYAWSTGTTWLASSALA